MSLLSERLSMGDPDAACQVLVVTDRCAGCQECIVRCPTGALTLDAGRWVAEADDELCVGCRQCVRTCPFAAIEVHGPARVAARIGSGTAHTALVLGDTSEIHDGFANWDEALAEANRCLLCPDPTCVRGCPAHNDIPAFISALRDGDLARAHDVLARTTVLPDVCSRVCNQSAQCEGACSWSLAGEAPVSIGRLERFVTDQAPCPPPRRRGSRGEGMDVAVVGSGPAGIGAAWKLIEEGADVTVYERQSTTGGLLDWGIPDFTLPPTVASRPWQQLVDAGVNLCCGTAIGPAGLDRLLTRHDAVLLAVGAGQALRMSIPGADLAGVIDATLFLQGAKTALRPDGNPARFLGGIGLSDDAAGPDGIAQKVLVLGAGNTAMDVARTARRFGLEATCIDWLDERFALTRPEELDEARAEGVTVWFSRTVTGLSGDDGRVSAARLARTTQSRPDRLPKVAKGAGEEVPVDLVVMAMGYRLDPEFGQGLPGLPVRRQAKGMPDRRWLASGILANPASAFAHRSPVGSLALGREVGTHAAAVPVRDQLWVIGDALVGPSTVVEAMAHGRRAAAAVLAGRENSPGESGPVRAQSLR
jgi:glutamate synthase (NADPH/NADH) small chain